MMQLGAEAVFVGSGIFMKGEATPLDLEDPKEREEAESRAKAIVIATTHYDDPKVLAEVSEQVTGEMKGLAVGAIEEKDLLQTRGWFEAAVSTWHLALAQLFGKRAAQLRLRFVYLSREMWNGSIVRAHQNVAICFG